LKNIFIYLFFLCFYFRCKCNMQQRSISVFRLYFFRQFSILRLAQPNLHWTSTTLQWSSGLL